MWDDLVEDRVVDPGRPFGVRGRREAQQLLELLRPTPMLSRKTLGRSSSDAMSNPS
jgi:hypothetical protein